MGMKPHHVHLWFESQRRSFWLTYDILEKVEENDKSPLLTRLQFLNYALDAEEWELEETGEQYKLISYIDRASFEMLVELRHYLDFEYQSISLYPEGMGRMIIQIEWSK